MTTRFDHALASNPAIALWLQSTPPAGRIAELGSFDHPRHRTLHQSERNVPEQFSAPSVVKNLLTTEVMESRRQRLNLARLKWSNHGAPANRRSAPRLMRVGNFNIIIAYDARGSAVAELEP